MNVSIFKPNRVETQFSKSQLCLEDYLRRIFNPPGGKMVSKEIVFEALKECYDPEIPVNVVDLGLIYDIRINDNKIEVDMTLTAPGCPMSAVISGGVKDRLLEIDGIEDVSVNMVWEPAWTPDKMSEDARKSLGYE